MRRNNFINKQKYDNVKIFSPDGLLMCYVSDRKRDWYLSRNLAEIIDEQSIRLSFKPKALGNHGQPYLVQLENKCVICGDESVEDLTKHHIIPSCFRKHFPKQWKNSRHFEVVFLCTECHTFYEREAYKLTKQLLESIGGEQLMKDYHLTRKYAGGILAHSDKIPEDKLDEMKIWLLEHHNIDDFSIDTMVNLLELPHPSPYKMYSQTISDYPYFIKMWKDHFIEVMELSEHLPKFWNEEYGGLNDSNYN